MREYSLDEIRGALNFLNEDDRDLWVQIALALKSSFGDAAFDIWDDWSAGSGKYNVRSARSVWKSAKPGKLTVGSVIKWARDQGWQPGPAQDETEQQKSDRAERKAKHAELAAREAADAVLYHELVANHSREVWDRLHITGASKYLGTKKVGAFGVRFARESFLSVIYKDRVAAEIIDDPVQIKSFLAEANKIPYELRTFSFRHIRHGCFAVPMIDIGMKLWALQLIWPSGKKSFFESARKSGLMHVVAGKAGNSELYCIAEGYATAASIHMATGWPVVVAFDAGNLLPVAKALREQYPDLRIIIGADNDTATEGNPGVTKATEAAQAIGAQVCVPDFSVVQARAA